jgi:EAL domain-containing protein (putative c-di-GMP-specific phosphodiesterase class I)/DNA-binding response OmpR family regulator/GGDEF domain-containing protein
MDYQWSTDMQTTLCNSEFSSSPASESSRLLVVDDDAAIRTVSRLALEKSGFRVTEAADGYAALRCLQSQRFAGVLLDARMPGLDGFETCRQMRKRLGSDPVPIVIATGLDDDVSIQAAFDCGATDYAPKPLNWRIMTQRLHALIRARDASNHLNGRSLQISSLLKTSSEAVLMLDKAGVIQSSNHTEKLPDFITRGLLIGQSLFSVLPRACLGRVTRAWENAVGGESIDEFVFHLDHDGAQTSVQGRFIAGVENEMLCLLRDQTDAFTTERKLFELAYVDSCTGIANEKGLISELSVRLKQEREVGPRTVLIRCVTSDFHGFEPRLGRSGLDKLACALVGRIDRCVKEFMSDGSQSLSKPPMIARIAESHYVIALSGDGVRDSVGTLAESLLSILSCSVEIEGMPCPMDWKIGIASSTLATSPEVLLNSTAYATQSNLAAGGSDRIRVYSPGLQEDISRGIEMERLLRRDIASKALEVHYQPKFALTDQSLIGMEALIRWNNREMGAVSPGQFIPLAERAGLIIPLSHLVIESVLDQIVRWRAEARPEVPVSINISGQHLISETIVEEILASIEQRNIPCGLVELEVTESIMIESAGKAICNLHALRKKGVRISIDDFGTGYSSLSYLRELPIDCLKIDRSFVNGIANDPTARAIAKAIITVGHEVGLHVIAEGVETPEQLSSLKDVQCDSVQGFLTGRPVASSQFWRLNLHTVLDCPA